MISLFSIGAVVLAVILLIGWWAHTIRSRSASLPTKRRDDVSGISITLEIDDKRSLFILLAADGSINRLGTGTIDNTETGLFIGIVDPAIFRAVRAHLSTELLQLLGGTFQVRNPVGASCKLTIIFQFNDNSSSGLIFLYGSESEGPPAQVADLVRIAVRQTEPWYENFKRNVARRNNT